jgi:hypothetical protein
MKLTIKTIIPETVSLWHDDYGFIGNANEYEFNSFRIDIMENELEGYYVLKNKTRHYINKNGTLSHWSFFNLMEEQLEKLTGW